ncbi:MarR family transcriptional regulator [Leucobacter iarius]|uniref:HTH marR-type domain-containing protein n=1 Tax=Leucobacter iarius TaxID=333963 RepID=A0ABP4XGM1_9MICO
MNDAGWLDDAEQELWRNLLRITVELPSAIEAQLKRDAGVSYLDFRVLGSLSEAPSGTRTMSELAARMSVSIARLSVAVGRLERRSWVQREQNPDDGRATDVVLTESGRAHLEAHVVAHVQQLRRLVFEAIDPAWQAEFSEMLGRVLGTIGRDPCARFGSDARTARPAAYAADWSPLTGPRAVGNS